MNIPGLIGIKSKLASLALTVCLTVTHLLKEEIGLGKNSRKKKVVLDELILLWTKSLIICNFCSCRLSGAIFNYRNAQIAVMDFRIFVLLQM